MAAQAVSVVPRGTAGMAQTERTLLRAIPQHLVPWAAMAARVVRAESVEPGAVR
jgi:hypothetical protein